MPDIQVSDNHRPLHILVIPANEGGCAFYRAINPYTKLAEKHPDKVEVKIDKNPLGWKIDQESKQQVEEINEELFKWADVVMVSNLSNFGANYTCRCVGVAKQHHKFVHFDTDDLLTDLYPEHHLYQIYKDQGLAEATKWLYNNADLVTVTQKSFAERIKPYCSGVLAYIHNAIDYDLPCWNLKKRDHGKVCHIGWAGGIHHKPDVEQFNGVPHLLNQKVGRERVWFDFYGHPPMSLKDDPKEAWQIDAWKHYRKELMAAFKGRPNWTIHGALPPLTYGSFYANMDIAIAPLKENNFNSSKSRIKVSEAGRYAVPLVVSDVGCYNEVIVNGETGFLIPPNAPKTAWVNRLAYLIKNPKERKRMGKNLKKITDEKDDLNKVVKLRLDVYEQAFKALNYNPYETKSE